MKSRCKQDITDVSFIYRCIVKCIKSKGRKKRWRIARYLSHFCDKTPGEIQGIISTNIGELSDVIMGIAVGMAETIQARTVPNFEIRYIQHVDRCSGKVRTIGIQSTLHQFYEYVAVEAMIPMLKRRIGQFQEASFPKRGQVPGAKAIRKWIRSGGKNMKYFYKCDIRHCYESIDHDVLFDFLARDLMKNQDLLYLVKHLVSLFDKGLSIGSLLSQWLCNYLLSFLYHKIRDAVTVTKRRGKVIRTKLVYKQMFFMDDIVLFSGNLKNLKKAAKMVKDYVEKTLKLFIKPGEFFAKFHYVNDGKESGRFLDFMGFRFYRDRTTIRRSIFLRARRCFLEFRRRIKRRLPILLKFVKGMTARWGWIVRSDSRRLRRKYRIDRLMDLAEKIISAYEKGKLWMPERSMLYA